MLKVMCTSVIVGKKKRPWTTEGPQLVERSMMWQGLKGGNVGVHSECGHISVCSPCDYVGTSIISSTPYNTTKLGHRSSQSVPGKVVHWRMERAERAGQAANGEQRERRWQRLESSHVIGNERQKEKVSSLQG